MRYYLVCLDRTEANKKIHYWNKNNYGYVTDRKEANTFTFENALALCLNDVKRKTAMMPMENVQAQR